MPHFGRFGPGPAGQRVSVYLLRLPCETAQTRLGSTGWFGDDCAADIPTCGAVRRLVVGGGAAVAFGDAAPLLRGDATFLRSARGLGGAADGWRGGSGVTQ